MAAHAAEQGPFAWYFKWKILMHFSLYGMNERVLTFNAKF